MRWIPFTLGAMVIAAVVAVDPGGLSPFGPTRWWLVSSLALAAGGSACWSATRRLDRRSARLWGLLLVLLTVSAVVNGDTKVALLGHPVRHLGLLTWGLFALVFATGQQLVRTDDRRIVVRSTVVAAVGLGAWCTWELAVGPPIALATTTERLSGPFGSAAMLGAACCLLTPICTMVVVDRHASTSWRIAGAVGAATSVLALIGSGTRAAWIGMAIAAAVLLVRRRPSTRTVLVGAGSVVVALAVLSPRLDDIVDRSNGTSSRLDEWALAGRVIGDHVPIGTGPEGYRIAAVGAVDADYELVHGRDRVLPDRAHSGPLDVAAIGGLPAATAYVLLVGGIVWRAVRQMRAADPMTTGLSVALVAYAVQQLLLFPLAELDGVWWLVAGMLIAAAPDQAMNTEGTAPAAMSGAARAAAPTSITAAPTSIPTEATDLTGVDATANTGAPHADATWAGVRRGRVRAMAIAAFALVPVVFVAGVLDVAADRQARRAMTARDTDTAVTAAERSVDLRPDDLRYRSVAIEAHRSRGTLADIDVALDHADAALRWSPDDPIALDARATLLLDRAAITGTTVDTDAAVEAWRRLVDRDPVRARWLVQLGRAAALAGDIDEAHAALTEAAMLRPDDASIAALLAELEARS